MRTLVVTTERGSTYVVGPSPVAGRIRLARMSGHPVRGTLGPVTFVTELESAELVAAGDGLCLECRTVDGQRFRTSPIVSVEASEVPEAASAS